MNKDTYAYLDGIPDRTSDLHNDAGFLNEPEVQAEIGNYLDIDDATAGQVLTMGESGFPEWEDVASGGIPYSTTEQDTGTKWIDGKEIYCITVDKAYNYGNADTEIIPASANVNMVRCEGISYDPTGVIFPIGSYITSTNNTAHIRQLATKQITVNTISSSSDYVKSAYGWKLNVTIYYTKN